VCDGVVGGLGLEELEMGERGDQLVEVAGGEAEAENVGEVEEGGD
jgi:hypothetical protein